MGSFDYSALRPIPSFLETSHTRTAVGTLDLERSIPSPTSVHAQLGEQYWANDGAVPVFSQWHPLPCG